MLPNLVRLFTALAQCVVVVVSTRAADVTVTPAASNGFVVKDAAGLNERLRVQESGAISLPGLPGAASQSMSLCMSGVGLLGPCSAGSGGTQSYSASTGLNLAGSAFSVAPTYQLPQGCAANQIAQWSGTAWTCASGAASYSASTGLALAGTAFSVAPTYQLPQGCAANQIAQWSGSAWACANASAGGATLPAGTYEQTLRYNSANTLVANNLLLAYADGGLVASGSPGNGTIPTTGAGTRLMWYPSKSALRAGHVGAAEWDDASIGQNSIAFGLDSKAIGMSSFATGAVTTASGNASTALGAGTLASGAQATALGDSTTASGTDSTALGGSTTANGEWSTALGFTTSASGNYSTAMGGSTVASGNYSTAIGSSSVATGISSIAMGQSVTADGDYSIALGHSASSSSHTNAFIWSDGSTQGPASNDADGQFFVNASGGVKFQSYLEVDGTTIITATYDYFTKGFDEPVEGTCTSCQSHPSIYAPNGPVMAVEFESLSDARIKNIVGLSDSAQDLATLNAIEITDYRMRDKVRFGDRPQKKVIAQQVEQVLPQLVSKHTDYIPNVYKAASHIEPVDGGYKLSFDAPHGITASAKKLRLLPEGRSVFEPVDIVAIPSPREVIVRASGWTAEHVFIFGEQVDDLRTVDYDGLSALNVSATQELGKRLDVQQTRQAELVAQVAARDAQLAQMYDRLAAQQRQLALQSDELAAQRERIAALQAQSADVAALKVAVAALQRKPAEALLTAALTQP